MTTTEVDRARQRLAEIKAKYTRPDEQQYLRLLIPLWEAQIAKLEREAHAIQSDPKL